MHTESSLRALYGASVTYFGYLARRLSLQMNIYIIGSNYKMNIVIPQAPL